MADRQDNGRHGAGPCRIDNFWLPTMTGATSATWVRPNDGPGGAGTPPSTGVLVVSGIVHEQQTMAVGVVALARELASNGIPALTIDLAGTANGSGDLDAPDVGAIWDDQVRSAVRHLRDTGLRHVIVIGIRLGALIAAHATVDDPVDLMMLWAPVLSGRRHTRELQMMQAAATETTGPARPGITVAGFNVPPALVGHLKALDAGRLDGKPAGALCVVDTAARLADLDDEHPLFASLPVERLVAPETEDWLFTDADAFPAPFGDIARICRHIQRVAESFDDDPAGASGSTLTDHAPELARSYEFEHHGVAIRETHVSFGEAAYGGAGCLRGILSEPVGGSDPPGGTSAEPAADAPAYVAVTSVGPGRIFVDFARGEAAMGRTTLRFELGGFGTSTSPSIDAWAEFYHPTAHRHIDAAVDLLVAAGHRRVHIVGFCAGAWSAFQTAPRPEVAGIIAINAQLLIRTRLLHRRLAPEQSRSARVLARIAVHPQVRRVVQKLERDHPVPSPAIRWVGRHVAAGTAVTLVYSEGDLGHRHYTSRVSRPGGLRRASRRPALRVYEGLGHLPSGEGRQQMLADIHGLG